MCVCVCMYVCMCACVYVHCVYVYVCTCMCICVYLFFCTYDTSKTRIPFFLQSTQGLNFDALIDVISRFADDVPTLDITINRLVRRKKITIEVSIMCNISFITLSSLVLHFLFHFFGMACAY